METDLSSRTEPAVQVRGGKTRQRLLAIITFILVVGALKVSAPVTMPLAFALFLIAIFWPLQKRFEKRMPRVAAAVLTLLCFLAILGLLGGALWFAGDMVSQKLPQYSGELQQLVGRLRTWAEGNGIPLPFSGAQEGAASGNAAFRLSKQALTMLGAALLVVAYLVLGLLEVHDYGDKLDRAAGEQKGTRWMDTIQEIATDFQRYIFIRSIIGLITGSLVFVFSLLVGLDFAFIWGLFTFIVEYVPTVGSFLAMIPPTLFALFQFGLSPKALLVFLGLGTIQTIMGQFVDPMLEGKYLELSPVVVLFSIAFWGWVWGVPGAFIAVPLTTVTVIACNQFDRTRWIAILLSHGDGGKRKPA